MIWVDMDGVVADFDGHYERHFGVRPTRWPAEDSVDWKKVAAVPNFFRTIPMTKDAGELLAGLHPRPWSLLTGCPKSIDVSDNQKRDWAAEKFEPRRHVVCCRSRDKWLHGKPGDVLIDDYLKYKDLWVDMGGIFIHHTSAANSIRELKRLGL